MFNPGLLNELVGAVNLLVKSALDPLFVIPGGLKPGCGDGLTLNGVAELGPVVDWGGLIAGLVVIGPGVAVGAGVG